MCGIHASLGNMSHRYNSIILLPVFDCDNSDVSISTWPLSFKAAILTFMQAFMKRTFGAMLLCIKVPVSSSLPPHINCQWWVHPLHLCSSKTLSTLSPTTINSLYCITTAISISLDSTTTVTMAVLPAATCLCDIVVTVCSTTLCSYACMYIIV